MHAPVYARGPAERAGGGHPLSAPGASGLFRGKGILPAERAAYFILGLTPSPPKLILWRTPLPLSN